MKRNIEIIYTEEDNGDCELGCWNIGKGVVVKVDGETVHEQEAWASCIDYSSVSQEDLIEALLQHFNIVSEVKIEMYEDYYDTYEEDLLDE